MSEDTIRGHRMTDIESNLTLINEMDEGYDKIREWLEYIDNESIPIANIDGMYLIKSWHSGNENGEVQDEI